MSATAAPASDHGSIHTDLTRFAWLSIGAALATLLLKLVAWKLTSSVGLLSDAIESFVNLGGATMALLMLRVAARPPDAGHAYGHGKAEYFSSLLEGGLVLVAGAAIFMVAIPKLMHPQPLQQAPLGLMVSAAASAINLVVARILLGAARRYRSIALEADGHHLMADVWTSAGVIGGVAVVALTGWNILDPLLALAVAAHVLWTGVRLLRDSSAGLMDAAWPDGEQAVLRELLNEFRGEGVDFHAVRTRVAGRRRFVSMHVLVPGEWTVQRGHDLVELLETRLATRLPGAIAFTHMEPLEDPASHNDLELDR
jgi:cation diffusion facilitator family transporter